MNDSTAQGHGEVSFRGVWVSALTLSLVTIASIAAMASFLKIPLKSSVLYSFIALALISSRVVGVLAKHFCVNSGDNQETKATNSAERDTGKTARVSTIILIGATGLTGGALALYLLVSKASKIYLVIPAALLMVVLVLLAKTQRRQDQTASSTPQGNMFTKSQALQSVKRQASIFVTSYYIVMLGFISGFGCIYLYTFKSSLIVVFLGISLATFLIIFGRKLFYTARTK